MPNCFMLRDKVTGEPALLSHVDDRLRETLGEPPDAEEFLYGWYDTLGFGLAMGRDWEALRGMFDTPRLLAVIDLLEEWYTTEVWAERR